MDDVNIIIYTVAFVHDGDRILLGRKQRGIGRNLLLGFGGKVEPCETIEQAAIR